MLLHPWDFPGKSTGVGCHCLLHLKEISPEYNKWCWSWSSNTLATWWEELTHWKIPWWCERLRAKTQKKTLHIDITRWSILKSDWLYSLQLKMVYFCSVQSAKTRPVADCGSNHELLIAKFRLKLKKVGKTTRPLRYGLNQIPYNYTVEVTDSRD